MDSDSLKSRLLASLKSLSRFSEVLDQMVPLYAARDDISGLQKEVASLETVLRSMLERAQSNALAASAINHKAFTELELRVATKVSDAFDFIDSLLDDPMPTTEPASSETRGRERLPAIEGLQETAGSLKAECAHLVELTQSREEVPSGVHVIPTDLKQTLANSPQKQYLQDEKQDVELSPGEVGELQLLLYEQAQCRRWCPCSCHGKEPGKAMVPEPIQRLFGNLFVYYGGTSSFQQPCSFSNCEEMKRSVTTAEYWLPAWLASRNIRMQLTRMANTGPQLQLSTIRRVPDTSQAVIFAHNGNIEGLKHLFAQGLAAPPDVSDSRGFSLMRWALKGGMHQYETVRFLISQGAPIDDITYEHVCDFVLRGNCNDTERQQLACVTQDRVGDWLDEQNFPEVHQIVLGMSKRSLAMVLNENPAAVSLTDTQGRTALDWATARGQAKDVSLLLSHGSDPNNMDVMGRTTVLHAVDSHEVECLRLILEAGGNPDPKIPRGLFRSSPLTASGHGGLIHMVKLLLEFGANPNACNPEGFTALHSVASAANSPNATECTRVLLRFGADPDAATGKGNTPLSVAISYHNHAVLDLLIQRCDQTLGAGCQLRGAPLLGTIAEFADIESINMVASAHCKSQLFDLSARSVRASLARLADRHDYSEKLAAAFEGLLSASSSYGNYSSHYGDADRLSAVSVSVPPAESRFIQIV